MITTAPSKNYFRATPLRAAPTRVDQENQVIYGAALMQAGPLSDLDSREMRVDADTLRQVVEFGQQSPGGVKARFTHPNMSSDGMGKHLGRWKNFRVDGETVRADLHLAAAAAKRDYGQYVMDFAAEDPELFGNSLHVKFDDKAMEGTEDDAGLQAIRISKVRAADVVDSPAATHGGMFSTFDSRFDIPGVVTDFLDTHFAGASPEVVHSRLDGFLNSYFSNKGAKSMATATAPATPAVPDYESKFAALESKIGSLLDLVSKAPQQIADAQMQANTRAVEITAAFSTAGFSDDPALQAILKDGSKTLTDARATLFGMMLAKQGGSGSVAGGSGDQAPKDADAKFKAEFAEQAAYFKKSGKSEADYVASRRIDEGLDPLILRVA